MRQASAIKPLVFLAVVFTLAAKPLCAQEYAVHRELKPLIWWDTAFSEKSDEEKLFKKRMPKKMFYGLKTRKQYAKKLYRRKPMVELFYVLKEWEDPSEYVQEVYWFDKRRKKVRTGPIRDNDKPFAQILHGPYQRIWNGIVLEEGQFWVGTKHGRWMEYSPGDEYELLSKEKYYKGFYKESLISYLTAKREKVREVVPIKDGMKHGDYLLYHDNGDLAVKGQYQHGVKVGVWYEYYEDERSYPRRKRMIRYTPTYYKRKEFLPHIVIEYDDKGEVTYEYKKAKRDKDVPIKRPEDWDPNSYKGNGEEEEG